MSAANRSAEEEIARLAALINRHRQQQGVHPPRATGLVTGEALNSNPSQSAVVLRAPVVRPGAPHARGGANYLYANSGRGAIRPANVWRPGQPGAVPHLSTAIHVRPGASMTWRAPHVSAPASTAVSEAVPKQIMAVTPTIRLDSSVASGAPPISGSIPPSKTARPILVKSPAAHRATLEFRKSGVGKGSLGKKLMPNVDGTVLLKGVAYKKTGRSILIAKDGNRPQFVVIHGVKYVIDPGRRALKRAPGEAERLALQARESRSTPAGDTPPVPAPTLRPSSQAMVPAAGLKSHLSRDLKKTIKNARASFRVKFGGVAKEKQYCMFFNKFGVCKKKDACPFIHDPTKVAICRHFLKGSCEKTDGSCPLRHVVDPDKMPVCAFFLRGVCTNDQCPYSHVKVSSSAAICEDFVKGHCPMGDKCLKRHALECPQFAASGMCKDGDACRLPHARPGDAWRKRPRDDAQMAVDASNATTLARVTPSAPENMVAPPAFRRYVRPNIAIFSGSEHAELGSSDDDNETPLFM